MANLRKYADKKGQSLPHLYVNTNTNDFWVVLRVGKVVRKQSLETSDYVKALSKLPLTLAQLGDAQSIKSVSKRAPQKLVRDYFEAVRKEKIANEINENTIRRMDSIWKRIEPYVGNLNASQIRPDMMPDFILWHKAKHPGVQLFNTYKYLGNIFRYMVRVGAIKVSQVPELVLPKLEQKHHDKKKGRILDDAESLELLKHGTVRGSLIFGIAFYMGMRKMEIASLTKDRIKFEDGRYFFELTEHDTKTGVARTIPVPKFINPFLAEQINATESNYLFPAAKGGGHIPSQTVDAEWLEIKRQAKIKGRLRFHDLRHNRATIMAKLGVNPIIACTILGMSLKTYQMRYLKLSGKDLMLTMDQMTSDEA